MKPGLEDALRGLRDATQLATLIRIELTDEYLRLIAEVEAMPQNASGEDKSHVWPGQRAYLEVFKDVRRSTIEP